MNVAIYEIWRWSSLNRFYLFHSSQPMAANWSGAKL